MGEPSLPSSGYREREYQDAHYHDDEPEIQNDELPRQDHAAAVPRPRHVRLPRPKRRFEDD